MRYRYTFHITFIFCLLLCATVSMNYLGAQENGNITLEDIGTQSPDSSRTEELPPVSQEIAASVTKWPDTFTWRTITTGTGAIPFTYFFANLAFDLVRFGISGFDSSFAPWPFRNQNSAGITDGEKVARIGTALGISIGIGLLDSIFSKP